MVVTMKRIELLSLCLLVMISALAVTGCSKPKSSYDYLIQARHEHQNGNNQAALLDLKNALKKDPKNGEARLLMAQILNARGEGAAAEIELHKAIDLGVDKNYVAPAMGQALLLQRQYQKVIDTIKALDDGKGKVAADVYNVRGQAYLALMKDDDARSAFESALKEYPASADAYLGMARLAAMQDDFNEALRETDLALSKEPDSTKGWYMKATILRAQNKNKEARVAFEHVIQTNKQNISAHLGLVSMDLEAGQVDAAKAQVDAALKKAPKDLAVRYALAVVQFRMGKFQDAQDTVQDVLKGAPDHLPSILLRGALAYVLGSNEQALRDLSTVIAQRPGNAYARRLLAATQLRLGETNQALSTLQPLLKPESADAEALSLAGEAQLKAKNYATATEYLQKAIEINPKAQRVGTQLAISYLGTGETDRAIKELESVAKDAPGQSLADVILIVTRFQRNEYDQALAAISNMEKKLGPNPVTLNLRGTALLGKRDFSNARKAFEQALAIKPTYFPAVDHLARLDLQENKPGEARKRYETLLENDKKNVQAMLTLAELAATQHQEAEYANWLKKAVAAQPDVMLPYIKLVNLYLMKKDNAEALNFANKAAKANPNSSQALGLLGATQSAVGNKEEALKVARQLQVRLPNSPIGYIGEADILVDQKHYSQAVKAYEKALAKGAGSAGLIKLHRALLSSGDDKAADRRLTSWIQENPKDADVLAYAADYYMASNRNGDAIMRYKQLLNLVPQSAPVLNNLAILYQRQKDSRAQATAEQALKLAPGNPGMQNTLGWILVEQREIPRGLELLRKAATGAPNVGVIHYHLAVALSRSGDKTEAKKELEAAIATGQNFPGLEDAKVMLKGM